jgi:hypothetical protein
VRDARLQEDAGVQWGAKGRIAQVYENGTYLVELQNNVFVKARAESLVAQATGRPSLSLSLCICLSLSLSHSLSFCLSLSVSLSLSLRLPERGKCASAAIGWKDSSTKANSCERKTTPTRERSTKRRAGVPRRDLLSFGTGPGSCYRK